MGLVGIALRFASLPQLSDNCQVIPSTSVTSFATFCRDHKFTLCEKWLNVVSSNRGRRRMARSIFSNQVFTTNSDDRLFDYARVIAKPAGQPDAQAVRTAVKRTLRALGWVGTIVDRAFEKQIGDLRAARTEES